MASKPSIPKGTRDFSPVEVSKRNYIIAIMRTHFEKYGFQPIETPSFENSDTLMGKYGEEGDRLIFKILNSGNFFFNKNKIELPNQMDLLQIKDADNLSIEERIELNRFTGKISEKALRYDLTVPFARYVVQHQNEIEFPFKRYQIQPVWRADRPQKGRFREFYQCDADVVGSTSLWQEVELVQLYDSVFTELGLNGVTIKINNRKILSGIAEVIGASEKLIDFTVALDKLDKIGEDGVKKEMLEKGISEEALLKVQPLFNFTGTIQEKIAKLSVLLSSSEEGMKGVEELRFICDNVSKLGLQKATLDLDVTLARGLNYYTGAIFEVAAPEGVAMGSIGGGGRYDDLTGIFGLKNMSGVGISFGLDRIYLVLEELGLFPETVTTSTKVMFLNFGESQAFEALQAIQKLRAQNIKAELYPDATKMDKQFKHAERRSIPYVVKEISEGKFTLKNIVSGEQTQVTFDELLAVIK
jgi:histidyl-tRNA synthetase